MGGLDPANLSALADSLASLEDLAVHLVAVQEQSSHEGFLLNQSSIRPIPYPTLQAALGAVADGDAEAAERFDLTISQLRAVVEEDELRFEHKRAGE